MRFCYWMPVFGGWLRNVPDERMPIAWPYIRSLATESERHGFEVALIAEPNLNDIKGHRAPSLDCWTLAPAVAAATEKLELMFAVRPNYHSPSAYGEGALHPVHDRAQTTQPQRRVIVVAGGGHTVRRPFDGQSRAGCAATSRPGRAACYCSSLHSARRWHASAGTSSAITRALAPDDLCGPETGRRRELT